MSSELYWLDESWPGKLALAARPRGGNRLSDEISAWRGAGVGLVLSLLTPEEEKDLDLQEEQKEANVVVHCRQGVERSGLVAACLLVAPGMSPGAAIERVAAAGGVSVPETAEQRDWIDRYAAAFAK